MNKLYVVTVRCALEARKHKRMVYRFVLMANSTAEAVAKLRDEDRFAATAMGDSGAEVSTLDYEEEYGTSIVNLGGHLE